MPNLNRYDPTQTRNQHADVNAFDDPIPKVGPDVSAIFDDSESDPTEWAGSEALQNVIDPGRQTEARNPNPEVYVDAMDTGVDDADLGDEEDEADEEDLDGDDEDDIEETDERLIDENGFKKIH